ncbi:MAG: hypothetical protein JSS07_03555 [Proteobacteria bacterium]|nr:hypothetical protein [Pseudomonadota bacterium]
MGQLRNQYLKLLDLENPLPSHAEIEQAFMDKAQNLNQVENAEKARDFLLLSIEEQNQLEQTNINQVLAAQKMQHSALITQIKESQKALLFLAQDPPAYQKIQTLISNGDLKDKNKNSTILDEKLEEITNYQVKIKSEYETARISNSDVSKKYAKYSELWTEFTLKYKTVQNTDINLEKIALEKARSEYIVALQHHIIEKRELKDKFNEACENQYQKIAKAIDEYVTDVKAKKEQEETEKEIKTQNDADIALFKTIQELTTTEKNSFYKKLNNLSKQPPKVKEAYAKIMSLANANKEIKQRIEKQSSQAEQALSQFKTNHSLTLGKLHQKKIKLEHSRSRLFVLSKWDTTEIDLTANIEIEKQTLANARFECLTAVNAVLELRIQFASIEKEVTENQNAIIKAWDLLQEESKKKTPLKLPAFDTQAEITMRKQRLIARVYKSLSSIAKAIIASTTTMGGLYLMSAPWFSFIGFTVFVGLSIYMLDKIYKKLLLETIDQYSDPSIINSIKDKGIKNALSVGANVESVVTYLISYRNLDTYKHKIAFDFANMIEPTDISFKNKIRSLRS